MDTRPVLVLGSTGYVGGRLVPLLLKKGCTVRAAGRSVDKIRSRTWGAADGLEPVAADMHDLDSLTKAAEGCQAAFYLVHSMAGAGDDFPAMERDAAYNMVAAAKATGLERIIYLGGLGDDTDDAPLSKHLASRAEVGRILELGPAEVTVLRAAQILGSGSASFELMRYLADRLPVMVTPRWVKTKAQPISVKNVLDYLVGCLENPRTAGRQFDIGGPNIYTYQELFQLYAEEAGLRRRFLIQVPFLSLRLSSLWVGLVTPLPVKLARFLIAGLGNEVVCRENHIRDLVPVDLVSTRQAVRRALDKTRSGAAETTCHDAGSACLPEWDSDDDPEYAGGTSFELACEGRFKGDADAVWRLVESIGGEQGWHYADGLWRLRGTIDGLMSGAGPKRGRPRGPGTPRVGDAIDLWRVVSIEPGERLLLTAEMQLPGEALMEFTLAQQGAGEMELGLSVRFLPRGLTGIVFWWTCWPLHAVLLQNTLDNLAKKAGAEVVIPSRRVSRN